MTVAISPDQTIKSSEIKGLAAVPNNSVYLTPTTDYASLVAAPASGVKRVNQIVMKNIDASVTTIFYLKLVVSATDYIVITIQLAPGEKFILTFPWLLDSNSSIQAKVGASCDGVIEAGTIVFPGGMGVANFTGTDWEDVVTVAASSAYATLGMLISNSYTATQTVSLQVIDDESTVMYSDSKTLSPGAVWGFDLNLVMDAGWKIQVKHGAASYTGSAVASYLEVPA